MEIWSAIQRSGVSRSRGPCPGDEPSDPLDRALDKLVGAGLLARTEESGVFPRKVVYGVAPEAEVLVDLLIRLSALANQFVAARQTGRHQPQRRSA
jgi:DNA-binding HxlR family transcriptional regulator